MLKNAISNILQRPSRLFLLAAVLTLMISLLVWNKQADIHIYDTIYVVPLTYLLWPIVGCFMIFFLLYQWLNKFLPQKTFAWIHVILTLGTLLGAFIFFYRQQQIAPLINIAARSMTVNDLLDPDRDQTFPYRVIAFLLANAQIVFIFHLIYGLLTYSRKKPSTLS
ncbi:hypothetical protein [Chitinophaga sp. RAB17]|uniref:hypothetical protein n=1 Tax=Chitinophaga sp. RAB17 TaxID=3233049 RepID=UPI003F914778